MAGYSGTPLVRKLGIRSGHRVAAWRPPVPYADLVADLPEDVQLLSRPTKDLDVLHVFVSRQKDLRERMPSWKKAIRSDGMLWISWPKKSSKLDKDLDEGDVRRIGLQSGLVDVKICAVDEDWSGLKFVYRKKDRPK